ncbi:MAG: patatin-like phospholipase family protein [Armatimonadetes bacterium]|nr:patatin-like phospholipase family protein [Armatimonadota bacterium]
MMKESNQIKIAILIIFLLIFFSFLFAEEQNLERPKIGLVLSGGGAKGIAHIGVLKVLEEAGIEVDFITGTSMGSIIGGLYAIGYSAAELEKIILEQDWNELIYDRISRRNISLTEKDEREKYAASFPISEGKIGLPKGLVAGQKISALISKLTISVHHIEDFNNLPIPFLCIATDIENGKVVILDEGYLPDAIRASMSIPSAFAPIEIEGQLLVDGGLIRNFPVSDIKKMGADIVIGVDVSAPLYTKKELKSLVKIMEQSMSFQGSIATQEERKLCDILISPDIDEYNIMDFENADSLIIRGERAARKFLPQLSALADSLKHFPQKTKMIPITSIDSLFVTKIYIQGLRKVSKNLVRGKLQLKKNSWITPDELEKAIERVYGSNFFRRVTYKLEPVSNGIKLFVRVVEKTTDYFNVNIHYDSDMKSALLLNTTFRNLFVQGSKLSVNLELSDNLRFNSSYFIYTGWKPGIGFGLKLWREDFEVPIFQETGIQQAIFEYTTSGIGWELQTIFSNSSAFGGILEFEHTMLDPVIVPETWPRERSELNYFNIRGFINIDRLDRSIYPRKGIELYAEAKYIQEIEKEEKRHEPVEFCVFLLTKIEQLTKKISLIGSIYGGSVNGDEIPGDALFYLGGFNYHQKGLLPFVGYKFMALSAPNAIALSTGLQFEAWKGKFIIIKGNYAKLGVNISDLFKKDYEYHGYAITFGIKTPIGPMEFSLMKGSESKDFISYVNIGYPF